MTAQSIKQWFTTLWADVKYAFTQSGAAGDECWTPLTGEDIIRVNRELADAYAAMMSSGIQVRGPYTTEEAIEGLRKIHHDLQAFDAYHDQWDWMSAESFVDYLECKIADLEEQI